MKLYSTNSDFWRYLIFLNGERVERVWSADDHLGVLHQVRTNRLGIVPEGNCKNGVPECDVRTGRVEIKLRPGRTAPAAMEEAA